MVRRMMCLLMAACLLTGCAGPFQGLSKEQYQVTYFDMFDTVTTILGYAGSQEEFEEAAGKIHDELQEYHQLFDIYNNYENRNNLKTINDKAGIEPVKVDEKIIELLLDCRTYYEVTDGKVNTAMGSVLTLWHEARTQGMEDVDNARLPDREELKEAAAHCSFDNVIIDEAASTVYIQDKQQRLDVGAIAKGWAVEQVCKEAPSGFLVSVGGNVCVTGPKPGNDAPWVVGIQSPQNPSENLHTLSLENGCVVTSGDYQRYYIVDGRIYHHIIDPDTQLPGTYWKSVSIICEDSGLADALSTALFLLPRDQGEKLLEQFSAYAIWVDQEGDIYYSEGVEDFIRT